MIPHLAGVSFRLLGPVEAVIDAAAVAFARPQHRDLLGLLLLHPNKVLAMEQILDAMWGATAPPTATTQVQNMISALRAGLSGDKCTIRGVHAGYELEIEESRIDVSVFGWLLSEARAATEPRQAIEPLRAALALWRGQPLAGSRAHYAAGARAGLQERRLLATESLFDAELKLGHHGEIVPELTAAVAEHPFRERLVGQLMTALYRCGRQAEALDAYRDMRRRLIDEHGLDPSPALQELERHVLKGDPVLELEHAAAAGSSPGDSPIATAPPAARHHAPPAPSRLVGRDRELARIEELCAGGGARIAIYGPPGVGKTALALTAAERLRDHCPGGQLFVDLGEGSGAIMALQLLALLLRALGMQGSAIPDTEAERVMVLRGLVGGARLLLLLDGVAGSAQVRPALTARWAAVLLTSRPRLAALEDTEQVRLRVLAQPEAVSLLANTAPAQVRADPDGAARIAAACGGLPLAVRLAGAKLAARPHWTASSMAARLDDERRRLDELMVGDSTLRASFEVSYTTLQPAAQRVFRALGRLGPAVIEPWLAAAALGTAQADVVDPLEDLAAAQLLDPAHSRGGEDPALSRAGEEPARSPGVEYRLHDLLRVFAWERFEAQEPPGSAAELARRVAEAFLAVALRAEHALWQQGVHPCGRHDGATPDGVSPDGSRLPAEPDLIGWLSARRAPAQAAVASAHAQGLWGHCWALGRALIPVLEIGGHHDEWLHVSRLALDAAHRAGQPAWAAAIDAGLGTLHHYRGEWEQSRAALERAVANWERGGDVVGAAYARLVLAMTIRAAGGSGTKSSLDKALRTAVAQADPVLEVEALRCLAWVDRDGGRSDRAMQRLEQALRRVTEIRDEGHHLRGYVLHDLGVMQSDRRSYQDATNSLRTALRIFRRVGDRHWTGLALFRLGEADHAQGRLNEAVGRLGQALEVFQELHDRLWEATVLLRLGDAHRELGEYEQAERFLATSAELYGGLGQDMQRAHVQVVLGELREAQHDLAAARAAFAEAAEALSGTREGPWQERAQAGLDRIGATLPHEDDQSRLTAARAASK